MRGWLRAERIGQVFAFALGLVAISGGIWLIANDKDAQGLTAIISVLATLAGVFIYGRWQQGNERAEKRRSFGDKQLPLPYGQADRS